MEADAQPDDLEAGTTETAAQPDGLQAGTMETAAQSEGLQAGEYGNNERTVSLPQAVKQSSLMDALIL